MSEHFSLQELCQSDWADRNGVTNEPDKEAAKNLLLLAEKLEEVRAILGHPIHINSGYRSPKVNKAIGGSPTSSHQYGLAADITCKGYGNPKVVCEAIVASGIKFDQCILEFYHPSSGGGWVHLGIGKGLRQQVLSINSHGTFAGIRV